MHEQTFKLLDNFALDMRKLSAERDQIVFRDTNEISSSPHYGA